MGIAEFLESFYQVSPVVLFSRAMVASTWFLALFNIWKARYAPMANQAFFAALALVLGQFLLIFHEHFPVDTLTFLVSMAEVVMAISVVKMISWSSHLTLSEQHRIQATEEYRMKKHGIKIYLTSILIVAVSGLMYFTLAAIETGMHF